MWYMSSEGRITVNSTLGGRGLELNGYVKLIRLIFYDKIQYNNVKRQEKYD